MKYFVELFIESCAPQMTSSLHKNTAMEGSVGWLETSTIQIRRSGLQPTNKTSIQTSLVLSQDRRGRQMERGWLEHKEMVAQMKHVNGKQSRKQVTCDTEGETGW